jgi:hypothetical protein
LPSGFSAGGPWVGVVPPGFPRAMMIRTGVAPTRSRLVGRRAHRSGWRRSRSQAAANHCVFDAAAMNATAVTSNSAVAFFKRSQNSRKVPDLAFLPLLVQRRIVALWTPAIAPANSREAPHRIAVTMVFKTSLLSFVGRGMS